MKHPSISTLNRQIAKKGQPVQFQRTVVNASPIVIETRAFVRGYRPNELVGGITQADSQAILSPDDFVAAGLDPLPRKGDKLVIAGRLRIIEVANLTRVGTEVVRLDLRVIG